MPERAEAEREAIEIALLLEGVNQHYGFDFRQYARASLRRRLWRRVYAEGLTTISGLQERVLHDRAAMERLLLDLSINVTSMFRDPGFLDWVAFLCGNSNAVGAATCAALQGAGFSFDASDFATALLAREGRERLRDAPGVV